jgi:hypothetical protein
MSANVVSMDAARARKGEQIKMDVGERGRVDERGGMEAASREPRFKPIREGKLALVTLVDLPIDAFGLLCPRTTAKAKVAGCKVVVQSGQHSGRWFWHSFMMEGYAPRVRETERFVQRAMSCLEVDPKAWRLELLADVAIPVRFLVRPHWQTGKATNAIEALAADPRSVTYADYCKLVEKVGDAVPGATLYPDARAAAIVERQRRDATEVVEQRPVFDDIGAPVLDATGAPMMKGWTRAMIRRERTSERAVKRMEGK